MYGHDCAWSPGRKSGEHYMFMTYIYANHWRLIYINQYRRLMPICYLLMDMIQMIKKNQRGALMYTKHLDCFSAPLCLVQIRTIPDVHNVYMHGFSPRSAPSYSTPQMRSIARKFLHFSADFELYPYVDGPACLGLRTMIYTFPRSFDGCMKTGRAG